MSDRPIVVEGSAIIQWHYPNIYVSYASDAPRDRLTVILNHVRAPSPLHRSSAS